MRQETRVADVAVAVHLVGRHLLLYATIREIVPFLRTNVPIEDTVYSTQAATARKKKRSNTTATVLPLQSYLATVTAILHVEDVMTQGQLIHVLNMQDWTALHAIVVSMLNVLVEPCRRTRVTSH